MAKRAVRTSKFVTWVGMLMLAGSLALGSGAHIARADEQFDGETAHLPAGMGTSVNAQDPVEIDNTPADVREAKSLFNDMQVRGRRVREEANHAQVAAGSALSDANWLLDRANNCSLDFPIYLNDYQTNERYAKGAFDDITNKAFQDLVARSQKASAAVQDDTLRAKFVDDTDFWSKYYQAQIDDSTKQAKATLDKARSTADEAVKLYNQKCRPILQPQTVTAPAIRGPFRVGFMCSDGTYSMVDSQGNHLGMYHPDGSPFVDSQGNLYGPNCPTMPGSAPPTGNTGGNGYGNGLMKSMIPADPFFPQMPETGNPSHGSSMPMPTVIIPGMTGSSQSGTMTTIPGMPPVVPPAHSPSNGGTPQGAPTQTGNTTPTQTINTTIGAPVIR